MRPHHREELAAAVERFLADIRRLARAALQHRRDRLLGTVPKVAAKQPRKAVVNAEPTRARATVTKRPRLAADDVEPKRPPRARARVAATKRPRQVTVDVEVKRSPLGPASTPAPIATPTPAAVPVPAVVEPAEAPTAITPAPPTTITPAAASSRRRGTVKWFDAGKGYGFIHGDDGVDVFVHHTAITEAGLRAFGQGQTVEYDVRRTHKGLQAIALGTGQAR